MEINKPKYPNYFTWSLLDVQQPKNIDIEEKSLITYLDKIINNLETNDKIIGLQVPEGIKSVILELVVQINKVKPELRIITFFEPCFGSCDIIESKYNFIDKIFHFGNSGMPDIKTRKTIFIEMFYEANEFEPNLIIKKAKEIGNKIGLLYNIQFYNHILKLEKGLINAGFKSYRGHGSNRIKNNGQILGCNYTSLTNIENEVDGFIVLTHGTFHTQMIPIISTKKVLVLDVIRNKMDWLENIQESIISKRIQIIDSCKDAKVFGLLVSSKPGQNRIEKAYKILEELKKQGKIGHILLGDNLYSHYFNNFKVDAYINFACPRIAINNSHKFKKPLLTLTEAMYLLNNENYEFDTIM